MPRTPGWMGALLALVAVAIGAAVGFSSAGLAAWAVFVAAVPLLLMVGRRYPEFILVGFLMAGEFTLGERYPLDVGVALGGVVALLVAVSALSEGSGRLPPRGVRLTILAAILVLVGVAYSTYPEYGIDKGVRFGTLGVLAMLAPTYLVSGPASVRRVMWALVGVGLLLGGYALAAMVLGIGSGRAETFGGSPITLARATGLALGAAVALIIGRARYSAMLIPVVAMLGFVFLASGSRGPAAALVAGAAAVALVATVRRGSSVLRTALVTLTGVGGVAAAWSLLPERAVSRFALLLQSDPGESALARPWLIARAIEIGAASPLIGAGTGSYVSEIVGYSFATPRRYPHNLFAEVFAENGVVVLALMVVGVGAGLLGLLRSALRSSEVGTTFLLFAGVFTFVNAMVSGDLNDNQMLFAVLCMGSLAAGWRTASPDSEGEQAG